MPVNEDMVATLSLGEALELRKLLDRRIAQLALKTLEPALLDEIDDSDAMANATSLAAKASML
jgi:hypothetical protein